MLKIAVIFGGKSSEYGVSLQSATSVLKHLDKKQYEIYPIGITQQGTWYYYTGDYASIEADMWQQDCRLLKELQLKLDLKTKGFILPNDTLLAIDVAFPVLHGKNGEDGTIQGLLEMLQIPYVGCGILASALCMDKDRAHRLVQEAGIRSPQAITLKKSDQNFQMDLAYPVFVKPVKAGSSLGISCVNEQATLNTAIELAFQYDDVVIIEEAIEGFEVGCAVMGYDELTVGRVDEIEIHQSFFDFQEKYHPESAKIHAPARLSAQLEKEIQETACRIYQILGCQGLARVDLFLTPQQTLVFNEVNTLPGFTANSRFPTMMKLAGIPFDALLNQLIHSALEAFEGKDNE